MTTIITQEGDMLDRICLAYYGPVSGTTEWVLQHNPRLAELGPTYPAGIVISLPDLTKTQKQHFPIRLWD